MKAKIISAVVKDGKSRQITVNTELTPSIGIHIVGMNDIHSVVLIINFLTVFSIACGSPIRSERQVL